MGNKYCKISTAVFLLDALRAGLMSNLLSSHIQEEIAHPRFL
jgi:hypothetical protein